MPIEGGGNSRLLSLEQSLSIFVNQDNRNPVIFDPRPNTMEQLKERDRHTHNLVLATHHLLSATNSGANYI